MCLHQEETRTPRGVHCPKACSHCYQGVATGSKAFRARRSRMLHMLACLPILPLGTLHPPTWGGTFVAPLPLENTYQLWTHPAGEGCVSGYHAHHMGSDGCQWQLWLFSDLPLGSRSADPHSTAVWCGSLLHSSPQPHTAGFFHSSSDGVLATATKICARRHSCWDQSQRALRSPMSNLHNDALLCCHSGGGL